MSRTGTPEAYRKNVETNIIEYLREYADAAEASGSRHWAVAMREAAKQLQWPLEHAMKTKPVNNPAGAKLERIAFDKWFTDGGEDERDRQMYWQIWLDAARSEREACAGICDAMAASDKPTYQIIGYMDCAEAIRERSNVKLTGSL